jgi:hypothetical protein
MRVVRLRGMFSNTMTKLWMYRARGSTATTGNVPIYVKVNIIDDYYA